MHVYTNRVLCIGYILHWRSLETKIAIASHSNQLVWAESKQCPLVQRWSVTPSPFVPTKCHPGFCFCLRERQDDDDDHMHERAWITAQLHSLTWRSPPSPKATRQWDAICRVWKGNPTRNKSSSPSILHFPQTCMYTQWQHIHTTHSIHHISPSISKQVSMHSCMCVMRDTSLCALHPHKQSLAVPGSSHLPHSDMLAFPRSFTPSSSQLTGHKLASLESSTKYSITGHETIWACMHLVQHI